MRGQARFELVLHSFRNPSLAYQPPLLRGWVSSLHREGLEQGDRLEVWSFCIPGYEPCREGFGERLEFVGFRVPADRRTVRPMAAPYVDPPILRGVLVPLWRASSLLHRVVAWEGVGHVDRLD